MLVGLKLDPELFIVDSQVAVAAAHNGARHDRLHLLRHHADIGPVAAVVAEAIITDAVAEMAEQNDIMLEHHIRSPSAATTAATATAAAATAETAATAADPHATTAAAAHTDAAAVGLPGGLSPGLNIPKGVAAASSARRSLRCFGPSAGRPLPRAGPSTRRSLPGFGPVAPGPLTRTRPLAAGPLSCAGPLATGPLSRTGPISAGPENLIATSAPEIHPVLASATNIVVAEFLLHVRIIVSHALAMCRVVLPVAAAQRIDPRPVDVDVVVAPIASPAPVVSTPSPPSERPAGTKRESGRDEPGANISRPPEVIWRIRRIGPSSVHDSRIVVGHIDGVGVGLFDDDDLPALLLLLDDPLLLG